MVHIHITVHIWNDLISVLRSEPWRFFFTIPKNSEKYPMFRWVVLHCFFVLAKTQQVEIDSNNTQPMTMSRIKPLFWLNNIWYAFNLYAVIFLEFECQFEGLSRSISVFHVYFMYFNGILVASSWHLSSEIAPNSLELRSLWKSGDWRRQSEFEVNWY